MGLKPLPKAIMFVAIVGGAAYALRTGREVAIERGWIETGAAASAVIPVSAHALPTLREAPAVAAAFVPKAETASVQLAPVGSFPIEVHEMSWNAGTGMAAANGGPSTTAGSIMAKHGQTVRISLQNDCMKMQAELSAAATAHKAGKPMPANAAHFVIIMGDGAPAFLAGLNPELARTLGPDYVAEIVGFVGRSDGEDAVWGLPEWKKNPQAMRGSLMSWVPRDGDGNIAIILGQANKIPVNPDGKTYDPDAINVLEVSDFTDAPVKYITTGTPVTKDAVGADGPHGVCEIRPVVHAGKRTSEKQEACVQGFSSWTPADVTAAQQKGGLVQIASTRDYTSQMAAAVIGIKKINADHAENVAQMLAAILEGGDQVKSYPDVLARGAGINAKIFAPDGQGQEATGAYWLKYYNGVTEADKTGMMVQLGGSKSWGVNDALDYVGLLPGTTNTYNDVYTYFSDVLSQMYKKDIGTPPVVDSVLNLSYLRRVAKISTVSSPAEAPVYKAGAPLAEVESSRSWDIHFQTGSAAFAADTIPELRIMKRITAQNVFAIEIGGHTDNTGDPAGNQALSLRRAQAVANWLKSESPDRFPEVRFAEIKGFGQTSPLCLTNDEKCRSSNRRVVVKLGKQ